MNIKSQTDSILEHPFTKQAIRKYLQGDDKDIRFLLSEIQIHTYLTVSSNGARAYRNNKRFKVPQIIEAIRDMAPPENLDIRLPFVVPVEECRVITLSVVKAKIKPIRITNQLEITFTYQQKKPPVMEALMG